MPRTIKADGKTIVVPDDATDDEINQLVGPPPAGISKPAGLPPGKSLPGISAHPAANMRTGFLSNLYENSPLSLPETLVKAAAHPLDAATGIVGGIGEELGRSASQLGEAWNTPNNEPMKAIDRTLYSIPFAGKTLKDADEDASRGNYADAAGKGIGLLGSELLGGALLGKVPSRARATANFEKVMSKAANEPVNLTSTMPELTRMQELADRGGTMPTAPGKLLGRINNTAFPVPLNYREARDFASNLSGLTADEQTSLKPVIKTQAGKLSKAFNSDIGLAADKAGVLPEYESAMKEYAQAMKLRKGAINGAKIAIPAALGYGVLEKLLKPMLPER